LGPPDKGDQTLRVLVLGAGRIGTHLIRYLSHDSQNKLTVIEKSKVRCKELSNEFDMTLIQGDGSSPKILKAADPSNTDLLILATDNDEVNITAARNAKKQFGVPRVFAISNSPKNRSRLKDSGADVVVCPVELALQDLESMFFEDKSNVLLVRPELDLKIVEGLIPVNGKIIGKPLSGLGLPEKCTVSLICRNGGYIFPSPELELRSGDRVLLIGESKAVEDSIELLGSREES
jgi:trk system potassium uptake protein